MENLYKDLSDLQEDAANLTIRAPFAGKLQDVKEFQIDQDVSKGTVVATLVNDKQLKLSLYFSYAYEDQISVGQERGRVHPRGDAHLHRNSGEDQQGQLHIPGRGRPL